MVHDIIYSDRTESNLWFRVLHIATGHTASVVQCIKYSDRTDNNLWFMVLHIETGERVKCVSGSYK